MQGYCPTRANQAPGNAPRAPQVVWAVTPFPIPNAENFLPAEVVVDASGRAYVAIDASPLNPTGSPNQIFAIDPDGSVAWTSSFPSPVSSLVLGDGGVLWGLLSLTGVEASPPDPACQSPSTCVALLRALSPTGAVVAQVDVVVPAPPQFDTAVGYDSMALASDGSFVLESSAQGGLARASVGGALVWQWPAFDQGLGGDLTPPVLVGAGDEVVAVDSEGLFGLDGAGQPQLQQDSPVVIAAIDAQGDVVALTADLADGSLSLSTFDDRGNSLRTVPLGVSQSAIDTSELALAGDGTAVVLLANEVSAPGITKTNVKILAVDTSGQTRWSTSLDVTLPFDPATLTTHYGLFVDGGGTVVVTAGALTGIDLATGSVLWTLQPPNSSACLRPAVLGANGAILATQCDGTVFLAADP
jgi:outer membrane protein assembly factor BamB